MSRLLGLLLALQLGVSLAHAQTTETIPGRAQRNAAGDLVLTLDLAANRLGLFADKVGREAAFDLPALRDLIVERFHYLLRVRVGDQELAPTSVALDLPASGHALPRTLPLIATWAQPGHAPAQFATNVDSPQHHFALAVIEERPPASATAAPPERATFAAAFATGIGHAVLGGIEHVLFALALYFSARRARDLMRLAIVFAATHSITLGLSLAGTLPAQAMDERWVVAALGLSIVAVAAGNCFSHAPLGFARLALIGGFGLVHGLGWGSALAKLGAAEGHDWPALVALHLGLEIGLAIVLAAAAIFTAGWWQRPWYRARIAVPASVALGLGGGVFLKRAFSVLALAAFAPAIVPVPSAHAESVPAEDRGGLFFGRAPDPQKVRRYFVAAEPELWDYTPSGRDEMCGAILPPSLQDNRRVSKLRYVRYTDETFTTKVRETPSLGILGPVLRGMVGEFLVVTFLNRTGQPLSMHPHGVKYDKDSEGARYGTRPGKGASVEPNATFTYVWQLDEASGPLPGEPSSKGWLYHSHVTGDSEINDGLVGFIIVTDPKRARPDGTPADIDRELATLFLIFDESGLAAEAKEAYEYVDNGSGIPTKSFAEIQQALEAGARASINGRLFGNLRGLDMNEGERVRWYLFGLGSQQDFHTAHWHGQRVLEEGRRRTDVVELLPGSMKVVDLVADNPGEWLFQCHVADHMREGMFARTTVHPRDVVGVSRDPEHAFLGLVAAHQTLQIARAEAAANPSRLTLAGNVTVYEAFSLLRQTATLQLGGKTATFQLDQHGHASAPDATLRIRNGGTNGVIYGGVMEFELSLTGPEWLSGSDSNEIPLPLTFTLGTAQHRADVRIARKRDD